LVFYKIYKVWDLDIYPEKDNHYILVFYKIYKVWDLDIYPEEDTVGFSDILLQDKVLAWDNLVADIFWVVDIRHRVHIFYIIPH
jgi:hypothetical protein